MALIGDDVSRMNERVCCKESTHGAAYQGLADRLLRGRDGHHGGLRVNRHSEVDLLKQASYLLQVGIDCLGNAGAGRFCRGCILVKLTRSPLGLKRSLSLPGTIRRLPLLPMGGGGG